MIKERQFGGYRAKEVYLDMCAQYGFEEALAKHFGNHRKLYAPCAADEKGVWFISNSNWTKSKGGNWKNTIAGDLSWIKEEYDDADALSYDSHVAENRLVWAKDPRRSFGYVFIGEYNPVAFDVITRTKRYIRVAATYDAA